MSAPMETDRDSAEMQPIDLSVRKNSVLPLDETPEQASRPTVVVMQSPATEPPSDVRKPQAVVSPHVADVAQPRAPGRSAADTSSSSHRPPQQPQPQPQPPLYFTERDGPFGAAMAELQRMSPNVRSSQRTSRLDREIQQQRLDMALQRQQLEIQEQQQQLRFQQQLHQHQLRLAAFGNDGVHAALHLDNIMLARQMAAGSLFVPMPPSPASSTESNPFPFSGAFGCSMHHQVSVNGIGGFNNNNNTRPYFNGLQSGGRGLHLDGQLSPASTTSEDQPHHYHHHHRFGDGGVFDASALIIAGGGGGAPEVDAEDVADIYRTAEFQAFRQRYMDSLGPPRNYEKMRRSVPAGKQPPAFDVTYAQKRVKNNEAAKKSRDAKRQKFLENQISVMYLTKKIREMNDLKRRLLMSMT